MAYIARVLKDINLEFKKGEIMPPELVSYLVRTCKIVTMVENGDVEIGTTG